MCSLTPPTTATPTDGPHATPGHARFAWEMGPNGQHVVVLTHSSGSAARIFLHGATLTSFRDEHGTECLFTSERAVWDARAPIRGGVPLVFPQFGAG